MLEGTIERYPLLLALFSYFLKHIQENVILEGLIERVSNVIILIT